MDSNYPPPTGYFGRAVSATSGVVIPFERIRAGRRGHYFPSLKAYHLLRVLGARHELEKGPMTEDKTFRFTLRIHWSDADPAGIVYFSRFFKYFELAEFEMYRALGKEVHALLDDQGIWFPRVEAHCRYLRPIRWDDMIEIHLAVAELSNKSATYLLKVFREGESGLLAEGRMTVVCTDQKTFRARPIPSPLYEFLEARLQERM